MFNEYIFSVISDSDESQMPWCACYSMALIAKGSEIVMMLIKISLFNR